MTLIDCIDLSSDDEIFKNRKAYSGRAVYQGIDIVDLGSDNETDTDDHSASGQGHAAQHRTSCDQQGFIAAGEGKQHAFESGNAVKATASFLQENGNLSAITSQNFPHSLTTVPSADQDNRVIAQRSSMFILGAANKDHNACIQDNVTQRKTSLDDVQAVFVAANEGSQLTMESQSTAGATTSFSVMENLRVGRSISLDSHQASTAVPPPGPTSTSPKDQTSEAPGTPWRSPRLKQKHKDHRKSVVKLAVELKSSRMLYRKTASARGERKNTSVKKKQKDKLPSSTTHTSAAKHGYSMSVDNPPLEADAVAAQAKEVDPTGSLSATV